MNSSICNDYWQFNKKKPILKQVIDIPKNNKNQRQRRLNQRKRGIQIILSLSKISKTVLLIQTVILLNYVNGILSLYIYEQKYISSSSSSKDVENIQPVNDEMRFKITKKYNRHDPSLENKTLQNFCYCNYGKGVCDYDEICVKHDMAACFHAVKQVYLPDINLSYDSDSDDNSGKGRMQTQHFYGCAPLERGSNASHLTCNSWRSTHSTPSSIACCYEGYFCNMNLTLHNFGVSENIKTVSSSESIFSGKSKLLPALLFLCIGCAIGGLLLIIPICIKKRHRDLKQMVPFWMKKQMIDENKLPSLFAGNEAKNEKKNDDYGLASKCRNNQDFETTGSGSGSGGVTLNQRTIALDLTMLEIVARGRYGEVYKAIYRGSIVAVKTFYTTEEESWKNERDIYQTQMLNHENILQYVAADISSNVESITQMMLITNYHALGSLYDYLRERRCYCSNNRRKGHTNQPSTSSSTPFFATMQQQRYGAELSSSRSSISCSCCHLTLGEALQLAHSIISGIEHLHSPMRGTGSRRKPEIAHRDIKSKNVIVKRPGVCCIADFGLALRFENNVMLPENISVQVGTKRYMAPEVLNRTLNIANFDEFKFADIYSFSLVFWEILQMVQLDEEINGLPSENGIKQQRRDRGQGRFAQLALGGIGVGSFSSSSGIATGGSDRSTSFLVRNFHYPQSQPEFEQILHPQQEVLHIPLNSEDISSNMDDFNGNDDGRHKESSNREPFCHCYDYSKDFTANNQLHNIKNSYVHQDLIDENLKEIGLNNELNEGDILLANETTNLISRSASSVTSSTRIARTYLLPYQAYVESDPSFEEMCDIVCKAKLRPTLEPEWFDESHPTMQRLCELMCECWCENVNSRHTSLKIKKELANLIAKSVE